MPVSDQPESQHQNTTRTPGHRRITRKDLQLAEARARIDLAAAMIALDERAGHIAAGADVDDTHETAVLEQATKNYLQALSDLVIDPPVI